MTKPNSNPPWRQHTLPASTNPVIARQLCQMADLKPTDILLDPFCGCATIPLIAITEFNINKSFASDLSGKAIDCAEKNAKLANVKPSQLVLFRSNVSMIKLPPQSIDKIITNLPFGIRTGTHEKNTKYYQIFAKKCYSLLKPTGIGVILTQEKKLFLDLFNPKFTVKKIETVDINGLTPDIFQIKPTPDSAHSK